MELNDLQAKLDNLKLLIYNPQLFIYDYFYNIRNDIDLKCEELIIKSSNQKLAELSDCSSKLVDSDDVLNPNQIELLNTKREKIIEFMKLCEKQCLDKFKLSSHKYLNQFKAKSANYQTHLNSLKQQQSKETIEDLNDYKLKMIKINQILKLNLNLDRELTKLKQKLLINRSFLFKSINLQKNGIMNFGTIYLIEEFLNEDELDFLKNVSIPSSISYKEILENLKKINLKLNSSETNDRKLNRNFFILKILIDYLNKKHNMDQQIITTSSLPSSSSSFNLGQENDYYVIINGNFIKSSLNSYKEAYFIETNLDFISSNSFNGMFNLRKLNLVLNRLKQIDNQTFYNLKKLEYLSLDLNLLAKINKKLLSHLDHLVFLSLSSNRLESIEDNSFLRLANLQTLNLENNLLKNLNKNIFIGLASLKSLNLSRNRIDHLNENTFVGLISLEELNLESNQIKKLNENIFKGLNNLKSLNLSDNQIVSLDVNSFCLLKNLNRLCLSFNKLRYLIDLNNENMTSKNQLLLFDKDQINSLNNDLFSSMEYLQILDLSFNQLESLNEYCFKNLKQLEHLNLNSNRIRLIKSNLFESLFNLKELYIQKNNLTKIENGSFRNLNKLEKLDLSNNLLRSIKSSCFNGLANLKNLRLENNHIDLVDKKFISLSFMFKNNILIKF